MARLASVAEKSFTGIETSPNETVNDAIDRAAILPPGRLPRTPDYSESEKTCKSGIYGRLFTLLLNAYRGLGRSPPNAVAAEGSKRNHSLRQEAALPYRSVSDLPKAQTDPYTPHQKEAFLKAFNYAYEEYGHDGSRAFAVAHHAAKLAGDKKFFKRCWPHRHDLRAIRIEELFATDDEAFVRYPAEPKSGAPFRNVEFIRLDGPKVRAVEVYYGPSEKKH